jgi:hypothetical protein
MRMFRRRPGQPKFGPWIVEVPLEGPPFVDSVRVMPLGRGTPRVFLQITATNGGCGGYLAEDGARRLSQALLDGIEQSKALTESG